MSLLSENTRRWREMHVKPERWKEAQTFAARALAKKSLYLSISPYANNIPWWAIALIHERECVGGVTNLRCSIGQGSPWNVKSRIIPQNGPFSSFEEAAIYNLQHSPPYAAKNKNWSGGGAMSILEQYNGLGYAKRGRPSPYIWAGSDQYRKGKYVRDGVYDPNYVDKQLGAAIMLRALMDADPTIQLDGDLPSQEEAGVTKEVSHASMGAGTIWASLHEGLQAGLEDWVVYSVGAVAVVALAYWVYRVYMNKKAEV